MELCELCLTNSVWLDAPTRVRAASPSAEAGYHIPGDLKLVIRSSLRRSFSRRAHARRRLPRSRGERQSQIRGGSSYPLEAPIRER